MTDSLWLKNSIITLGRFACLFANVSGDLCMEYSVGQTQIVTRSRDLRSVCNDEGVEGWRGALPVVFLHELLSFLRNPVRSPHNCWVVVGTRSLS